MLNFQLSRLAEKDLENIWTYTFENWSIKQADKYIKEIIKKIETICSNPEIGRSLAKIKPNHRLIKVNSHLLIYKVEKGILKVDRILHKSMDLDNQL